MTKAYKYTSSKKVVIPFFKSKGKLSHLIALGGDIGEVKEATAEEYEYAIKNGFEKWITKEEVQSNKKTSNNKSNE